MLNEFALMEAKNKFTNDDSVKLCPV